MDNSGFENVVASCLLTDKTLCTRFSSYSPLPMMEIYEINDFSN